MAIQLGRLLPDASCNLPENIKTGRLLKKQLFSRVLLFGLAPSGVYQAISVTRNTGELLPHLFTLTVRHAKGGIFSAALSLGLPPVAVSDHSALWSPDFPLKAVSSYSGHFVCSSILLYIKSFYYFYTNVGHGVGNDQLVIVNDRTTGINDIRDISLALFLMRGK